MGRLKYRVLLDTKSDEEIFRDILIPQSSTFENFYETIIESFHLKGDVMASFYISNFDWDKGREISLLDMNMGDGNESDSPLMMSQTTVQSMNADDFTRFILVYDFMKMWIFLIELIGVDNSNNDKTEIVFSIGKSPKEDETGIDNDFIFESENSEFEKLDDNLNLDEFEDGYSSDDLNDLNEEFY